MISDLIFISINQSIMIIIPHASGPLVGLFSFFHFFFFFLLVVIELLSLFFSFSF